MIPISSITGGKVKNKTQSAETGAFFVGIDKRGGADEKSNRQNHFFVNWTKDMDKKENSLDNAMPLKARGRTKRVCCGEKAKRPTKAA